MRYHGRQFNQDTRGVAMLEVAVVLPVLLAIGLGVIEFGNLIFNYHLIENGVRDAARYAAGRPADCGCDSDIKSIAMTGSLSGGEYRVSWWNDPDTQISIDRTTVPNEDDEGNQLYNFDGDVPLVTVSSNVSYQPLGFLTYLGLGAPTLSVSHQERVIGVR